MLIELNFISSSYCLSNQNYFYILLQYQIYFIYFINPNNLLIQIIYVNNTMKKSSLKNIEVAVRMRPLLKFYEDLECWQIDHINKKIVSLSRSHHLNRPIETSNVYEFSADHLFDDKASNEQIYNECCSKVIEGLFEDNNGTVFMYGQTTSGKTYTMLGNNSVKGIIIHSLQDIFEKVQKNNLGKKQEFLSVVISYLEIYNEQINDLLNEKSTNLKIVDGTVSNLTEYKTNDYKQALKMLESGEEQRCYKQKNYHDHSSRSHTILQIKLVDHKDKENKSGKVKVKSILNLVDLAGSERTSDESICNEETSYINKSLFVLSNVIHRLAKNKNQGHIPFRDSKLTRLLAPSLTGQYRTVVICTVSPATLNFNQTLSTLRFANNSRKIQFKTQNQSLNQSQILRKPNNSRQQIRMIENLKQENSMLKRNLSNLKELSTLNKDMNQENHLEKQMKIIQKIANSIVGQRQNLRDASIKTMNMKWNSKAITLCEEYRRNIEVLQKQYTKAMINAASVQYEINRELIQNKFNETQFQSVTSPLFSDEL